MPSIKKLIEGNKGKKSKLNQSKVKTADQPFDFGAYQEGTLIHVDLKDVVPNPNQPRKAFDKEKLEELSQSIKQQGIIHPILVRKGYDGKFHIVSGERRYRAAKLAGLAKIPAIINSKGKPDEIALVENIQREDLKPIEEAEAYVKLMKEYNYNQEQLSLIIGKSRTVVTRTLSLNKLPQAIKEECRESDKYPRRTLVEVASQKTENEMLELWKQIKTNNLKSDQVRAVKKKPERTQRRKAVVILEKVQRFKKSMERLNLDGLESQDKTQILNELDGLWKLIKTKVI